MFELPAVRLNGECNSTIFLVGYKMPEWNISKHVGGSSEYNNVAMATNKLS